MILAGTLMLPDSPGRVRLATGWLRIEADTIGELHEGSCPHTPDLGGDDAVITPGFIDAHVHLPQFDVIGADGMSLLDWLDRVIFPAEAKWADDDFAADMTDRVIDQMLACGITGFAGYATVHHDATMRAIDVCGERGLRAWVGQVLMDSEAPADLVRPTRQLLAECEAGCSEATGRVRFAVTPRFAIACSAELLAGAGMLARRCEAPVQTHLAESREECERVAAVHPGRRYVEVYEEAGLLTGRTMLGHGIWLDDRDRHVLAGRGAVIAHCPTANTFLQSGTMNLAAHEAARVPVAVGSDVAGGPDRCMVRVARGMIDAAKALGHPPPTPAECWWRITAGNADRLGWSDTARLARDAEATLLILRPDVPWRAAPDPLGSLLYAWDDRWLRHVVLRGDIGRDRSSP